MYRSSRAAVEEQKKLEASLSVDVETARVKIAEIQTELEKIVEQLGEAKVSISVSLTSYPFEPH